MNRSTFVGGITLALALGAGSQALASSHRETPNTWQDPCSDHTDLYAWMTPGTHSKLTLIQVYNGLHEPGQGNHQTSLCDEVLYEFHIARGNGALDPKVTYQIEFKTVPGPRVTVNDQTPVLGGAELLSQLSGAKQTYEVRKVEYNPYKVTIIAQNLSVSPPNIGPRTDRLAYGLGTFSIANAADSTDSLYNGAFMRTFVHDMGNDQGRVWVGEADDPFFLDEDGIFDILNLRGPGVAKDIFAGFNANVIALEIPAERLTGNNQPVAHNGTPGNDTLLGIWNTTSRQKVTIRLNNNDRYHYGPWVQVSRQGLPLVNAGLIGAQDQHKYLRTLPKNDVANFGAYFLYPVLVRDLDFLGVYDALGVPPATVAALKKDRVDIVDIINLKDIPSAGAHSVPLGGGATGDVLRVDMALDSGFPNGRLLHEDVSDTIVTLVVAGVGNLLDPAGLKIGDNVYQNDVPFETQFPYVGVPHEGLGGGHGALSPKPN